MTANNRKCPLLVQDVALLIRTRVCRLKKSTGLLSETVGEIGGWLSNHSCKGSYSQRYSQLYRRYRQRYSQRNSAVHQIVRDTGRDTVGETQLYRRYTQRDSQRETAVQEMQSEQQLICKGTP